MTGHEARDDEREALRREFEFRIRTAVAYGIGRGRHADMTSQQMADWVQAEIGRAMGSPAVAGYRKNPEPEMEYEVTYSSANAPSVDGYALRRTSGVMTDLGKAREFAAAARNPMLRARTKGVPAGPWVHVGEGEQ